MVSTFIFFLSIFLTAIVDIKKRIIPDTLVFIILIIGILHNRDIEFIIYGIIAALLPILTVYLITKKGNGIGLGDVKLTGAAGAFLGVEFIIMALLISNILGAIFSTVLRFSRKRTEIPFAPFLFIGICITVLMKIINKSWYNLIINNKKMLKYINIGCTIMVGIFEVL